MSVSATVVDGLRYRVDGRVASIRLDRADRMNLLTREILAAILSISSELAANDDVSVLTITGEGEACFSTGILTPALRGSLDKPDVLRLIRLANTAFDALESLPQIVIAGLNGYCRAGAVELALACDIRIAGSHATLMSPEAKWGGFPGAGAPVRLPALIGTAAALEFLCTGREIDAGEMHRLGLIQRIVEPNSVHAALDEMARTIAANGPLATRGIKRIARTRMTSGFRAARDLSDEMRSALEWTQDVDEGIAAVREGRPPRFLGR
jgi:enoyl-CoA hydratase/carnithine racemase